MAATAPRLTAPDRYGSLVRRWSAWCGLGFVLLFAVGAAVYGHGAGSDAADIVAYYARASGRTHQLAGFAIVTCAGVLFAVTSTGVVFTITALLLVASLLFIVLIDVERRELPRREVEASTITSEAIAGFGAIG